MAFIAHRIIRFDDVDHAQVVYFPRFLEFCHQTFEDFFNAEAKLPYVALLGDRGVGFPAVHAEADYFSPLRFGDSCRISMELLRLGTRSITHRFRIYRGEDLLAAEVKLVMAAIAVPGFTPRDIPEDIRALLQRNAAAAEGGA